MVPPVAVVTGANRGLGLALVEALAGSGAHVVLTSRDERRGAAAAAMLAARGLSVEAAQLDVQCGVSIAAFGDFCERTLGGRVDLLVNNAAVCEAGWSDAVVRRALRTNVLGPRALTARLRPCLARAAAAAEPGLSHGGRRGQVLHISSGDGELLYLQPKLAGQMHAVRSEAALLRLLARARPPRDAFGTAPAHGPTPAYGLSKAALNALTRVQAAAAGGLPRGVWVGAVCPGDVLTRMATAEERQCAVTPEEAARHVLELVEEARRPGSNMESGRFWRYAEEIPF